MANDPWEIGDEARKKYMEKALHANDEAASSSGITDLFDKDSSIYKNPEAEKPKEVKAKPEAPTVDAEGYPIISQVHTFKEDLTNIISKDELSMSRIAMMQGNANRQAIPETKEPRSLQNKIYLGVAIFLFVISIGVVGSIVVINMQKEAVKEAAVVPKEKYIIFSEKSQDLDIGKTSKTEVGAFLKPEIQKFREEDSIMEITPTIILDSGKRRATITEFFDKLGSRVPSELSRTLANRFFFGLYSKKGRTDPFLIMYTSSYDIAYPALLDWEGFMKDDFDWVFNTKIKNADGADIPLFFKDRVVLNKDVRSFEDEEGRTAFFYTFLDDHTILFAKTSDTMLKVVDRIREAKFQ